MDRDRRPRPGFAFLLPLLLAVAGGIGLSATWLSGGHSQLEGGFMALAFGGLGAWLIRWAKRHTDQGPYYEDRDPPQAEEDQHEALLDEVDVEGVALLKRRSVLGLLGAALGAIGLGLVAPLRWLAPRPTEQLLRTAWTAGALVVREDGSPVHVGDVARGGILTVFPEGHTDRDDSQVILLRPRRRPLPAFPRQEDTAPQGLIAYSRLCTHAGCPVGLYEEETDLLYCPCHQSVFDAVDAARPLAGPATRRLPQLPLEVDDEGYLRARGDFEEPVGPGFWEMP